MKMKTTKIVSITGLMALIGQSEAALVANVVPANYSGAAVDDGGTGGSASGVTAANNALGGTLEVTFVPTAGDLTGTVPLIEFGGTSNGISILLIDGIPTWSVKAGSGDQFTADGFGDLDMGTTNATRPVAAQITDISILAGSEFTLALSYDGANAVRFGVQGASAVARDFTLTGSTNNATDPNWSGNDSLTIGPFTNFGSTAGLSGANAGTNLGAPWDVDTASPFAGTVTSGSYWNSVQPIVAVPEPSSLLLGLLALPAFLRRKRA